jgi:hypothetical protein
MMLPATGQESRSLRPAGGFSAFPGVLMPPVLDMDALVSGTQAAAMAGVSVRAIVNWRNRGWLPVAVDEHGREIRDTRGRPRYRLRAVLEAEKLTAARCEVVAPRLARRSPARLAA